MVLVYNMRAIAQSDNKCKELKGRSCFHKNKNKWDGINTMCKLCYNKYSREYKRRMRALRSSHGSSA